MATSTDNTGKYGWCGNPRHSKFDHMYAPTCFHFISDEDHTLNLLAQARKEDLRTTYNKEAAYVAEHRPY